MQKLTITEVQDKLNEIAQIDEATLRNAGKPELIELTRGIISGYSRLSKQELCNRLLERSANVREELKVQAEHEAEAETNRLMLERQRIEAVSDLEQIPDSLLKPLDFRGNEDTSEKNPMNLAVNLYRELIDKLNETQYSAPGGVAAGLAAKLERRERVAYPNITTRKKRRTDICNQLERCLKVDEANLLYPEVVRDCIKNIKVALLIAWRDEVVAYNKQASEKVEKASLDKEYLDPTALIRDAVAILEQPEKATWTELAIAIGITTGRRPAEIMCTGGFRKSGEYKVIFTGQTKDRSAKLSEYIERLRREYEIPSLVKADLVIKALEALQPHRIPLNWEDPQESTRMVNRKFSMSLSRKMGAYGLEFKDLRKLYAVTAYHLLPDARKVSQTVFYKNLLGHTDTTAAVNYEKYTVTDETIQTISNLTGRGN